MPSKSKPDFSPEELAQIQQHGKALLGDPTDFDGAVESHLADHYPHEASFGKMRAAATGGSAELGPSQAEEKQIQQRSAIQQQGATQAAVQAQKAQGAQAPIAAPEAPTGPQGVELPEPAQARSQPAPDVTAAPQTQQGEPPTSPGAPPTGMAHGGHVHPIGSTDTVPAMLTPGEFVMNKNAVRAIGPQKLEALNASVPDGPGTRRPVSRGYQEGGGVSAIGAWGTPLASSDIVRPPLSQNPPPGGGEDAWTINYQPQGTTYGSAPTPGWSPPPPPPPAPSGPTAEQLQHMPSNLAVPYTRAQPPIPQPIQPGTDLAPLPPPQTGYGSQPTPGFGMPPPALGGQPTIEQLQNMPSAQLPPPPATTPFTGKFTRQDIAHKDGWANVAYNNPGAQWEGSSARKFGATTYGILKTGNHIAKFDTPLQGAAAQFDLLASPYYANKPLAAVIKKWSEGTGGAFNVQAYVKSLGLDPNTIITPELIQSPTGLALAKKQAFWEGPHFSLSDDEWKQAQDMAFGAQ